MKKYDLTLLKEQCGGDKVFFNEMLEMFISSVQAGISGMLKSLQEADGSNISYIAHKIVAPCRHIEAQNLVNLLKELEHKALLSPLPNSELKELLKKAEIESREIISDLKMEFI